MSLHLLFVTALMLVCSVCDVIPDFDDVEGTFHFIYHDENNLLLMVSDSSCIYIRVQDSADETTYLKTYQQKTEEYLVDLARQRFHSRLQNSNLQSVRDLFSDLLADFHCIDHRIYTLTLDFHDIQLVQQTHCQWCSQNHCQSGHNCHSECPGECPRTGGVGGPG